MPPNASARLRARERLPRGQEARWIERGALDLLYSTAQAGSGDPTEQAGWLAGWAGLGWLAYKMPYTACRKIPCPSAAAQRAVGPQPIRFNIAAAKGGLSGVALKGNSR